MSQFSSCRIMLTAFLLLMGYNGFAQLKNKEFTVQFNQQGIEGLRKTKDIYPTDYVRKGKAFVGITVRYQQGNRPLDSLKTSNANHQMVVSKNTVNYNTTAVNSPLAITEQYLLTDEGLTWKITLNNSAATPLKIKDLEVPLFYNNQGGENGKDIFERHVIKHHSIAGNNSFIFWQRPTGLGPYLVMVPGAGTALEYFSTAQTDTERAVFKAFIHSDYSGNKEKIGNWRQAHSAATIPAKGSRSYSFKFRFADNYQMVRDLLVAEGLIDVRVLPGMTIPSDLSATIALRTEQVIKSVNAEFPSETVVKYTGEKQKGTLFYEIKFAHLGENKITIEYGDHLKTDLEFFITEPLETLYKKRASFIVNHQQHRDSTKWYNGLFSIYDMKNKILRGPDNADGFDKSRLTYVMASDDPVLGKAPFLAAKNVFYPEQKEIDAIEYYIKNFVWGGLQRKDTEKPNPYGLYGTPNWLINRDSLQRSKNVNDVNKDKMHIWRSYDYPHIMMLYFEMYKIAKLHPGMTHYLDKEGYLERAKETAKAYFKYPYEILPWYETYKWGCYNELLIVDLIAELEKNGSDKDADFLRKEWEKKAKYFIYDDPYPFRSEYAVDATAYESTHALAKYAVLNPMKPDSNLWFDKNLKKWYSHPTINPGDAKAFMKREIAANIASRGWLETSYYYYGSDFRGKSDSFTLSYMSQMGGWAILDDALNFSDQPAAEFSVGYGGYLSSFALINSGTSKSNYGYWYPGKENDGASGWAFEPQQKASTWIGKTQGRGPWYYDGEIDLGFGGATRMAATIITSDPVFGLIAYGGDLQHKGNTLAVVPKDGLRARFYYHVNGEKIDLVLEQDGFAKDELITVADNGKTMDFTLENRTLTSHDTQLSIKGLSGDYLLKVAGQKDMKVVFVKDQLQQVRIHLDNALTAVSLLKI